ncbi:hypothetical protein [Candidatus Villigracilis affinis]|uniref:hypothetical protein n=1 Tax=Candidatus Villigracilis affinis TaxID=3140682 RepID=UPI002A199957|nr:hypothetical protein [Anaerolineales bacterium]
MILITGLLPAIVRPQEGHTIVACFAISFAFLLFIPFEISDMPLPSLAHLWFNSCRR